MVAEGFASGKRIGIMLVSKAVPTGCGTKGDTLASGSVDEFTVGGVSILPVFTAWWLLFTTLPILLPLIWDRLCWLSHDAHNSAVC